MRRSFILSSLFSFILLGAFTLPEMSRSAETTTVEAKTETVKPLPEAGTTMETTTIQKTETQKAPVAKPAQQAPAKPVAKKRRARPVAKSETSITTVQTIVETRPRAVYSPKAMKKMGKAGALCAPGFKAYAGNEKKNICTVHAEPPDTAYSCVWKDKGPATFAGTSSGPCTLDFAEHKGNMPMHRSHYKSDPPFSYGTDVECCYRAAQGTEIIRKQVDIR